MGYIFITTAQTGRYSLKSIEHTRKIAYIMRGEGCWEGKSTGEHRRKPE